MKSEIKAYAKINLFLDITGRLDNGYHTLNTVMQQIDLYDTVTVEISEGDGIYITCDDPIIPCNEKNIAFKAAAAFMAETGKAARIDIDIKKNIPSEAGMGGSSTDGAAVLKALNQLYGSIFTTPQLCAMGAGLGADVPFCIQGKTAVCKGIGEVMTPVCCKNDYVIAVVKPDFSCSTPTGFRTYDEKPVAVNPHFDTFVNMLSEGADKWAGRMYNIFEVLYNNPDIEKIKASMQESNALGTILTGSGSAVFGIFADRNTAENAVKNIDAPFKIITNAI